MDIEASTAREILSKKQDMVETEGAVRLRHKAVRFR